MGYQQVDTVLPVSTDETADGWIVALAAPRAMVRIAVRREQVGSLVTPCRSTRSVVVPRVLP